MRDGSAPGRSGSLDGEAATGTGTAALWLRFSGRGRVLYRDEFADLGDLFCCLGFEITRQGRVSCLNADDSILLAAVSAIETCVGKRMACLTGKRSLVMLRSRDARQ